RDLVRLLDADADRAHILGKAGEIRLAVGPKLQRLLGLLAAVDAIEAALRLVATGIIVDHRHRVDLPAHRRFKLADVIPEASVAGERHHRAMRRRAFRAEAGRERPAEMASAADIALARARQIEEAAHPHAGMA